MSIKKIERLRDQGSNGSPSYERATKIAKAFTASHITVDGSTQNRRASDWCDPHQAPPYFPLKYGTPVRYFIGDAGCNPS